MKNNTKKQDILEAYAGLVVSVGLEGASIGAVARQMEMCIRDRCRQSVQSLPPWPPPSGGRAFHRTRCTFPPPSG